MITRNVKGLVAALVFSAIAMTPAGASAATASYSSNRSSGTGTYYVDNDDSTTYVVNGHVYAADDLSGPIEDGLWTGVNAATLGPPASSVNTQIRRACGLPAATVQVGGQRYQDIIGNGLMTGVNIATTYNNRQPGTPGCTVTASSGQNGKRVTVRTNPVTTTTNPYAVRVVTPQGSATQVYRPATDSSATVVHRTTPSTTVYRVTVDPWDASLDWTPVQSSGNTYTTTDSFPN